MGAKYFVSWYLHNKENDGWAYKIVNKYDTIDKAKKAYYGELANYVDSSAYDIVCVMLTDSYGNKVMSDFWTNYIPPEPESNEE